jgi:hypothetical protein
MGLKAEAALVKDPASIARQRAAASEATEVPRRSPGARSAILEE